MPSAAIEIRNFNKRYGRRNAVWDLSLEVPRGSVFGLLGQNGAAKTNPSPNLNSYPNPNPHPNPYPYPNPNPNPLPEP